jgi:hypothetical protein
MDAPASTGCDLHEVGGSMERCVGAVARESCVFAVS